MNNKIGVILRVKNEEQYIGFAIQSIIDFLPDSKILIINDNSKDDSLEIIRSFNDRISIKIIDTKNYTPGKVLNEGFIFFKQQYKNIDKILVISAHCQILNFSNIVLDNIFKNEKNLAVFGNQIPIFRGKKISKRYIWSHFKNDEEIYNMFSKIENRYFLHNAFCIYKLNAIEICPFDGILPGKEDRYWANDIVKKGYNFVYNPCFVVNHFYTNNGATWKGIG